MDRCLEELSFENLNIFGDQMRRKASIGKYLKAPKGLVRGKVTELDNHGYGRIAIGKTGQTVHFALSQLRAPSGHVISDKVKKGSGVIGMPVMVRARRIGAGTLMAGEVVADLGSGLLRKAHIGLPGRRIGGLNIESSPVPGRVVRHKK